MKYSILFKTENEAVRERYELAFNRIELIPEEKSVQPPFRDYFIRTAEFLLKMRELVNIMSTDKFCRMSLNEHEQLNYELYADILPDNYEVSYANPEYAVRKLGRYGKMLSYLYTEIRGMIVYAFEHRLVDITINAELFLEIYNMFQEDELPKTSEIKNAIYWFVSDYSDVTAAYRIREGIDPELDFAVNIIMTSDFNDLTYLYKYGEYIGNNEIETAKYLNTFSQEKIDAIAHVYTEGYRRGFENSGKDLSKKGTVDIRYYIGFERIVKSAIKQFESMGLEPVIYRNAVNSINRKQSIVGYSSTLPNKQYWYDHRFDNALYLDKAFVERKLGVVRTTYEEYKQKANLMAGPAVIEIFGEEAFEPRNKKEALTLSKHQQRLSTQYASASAEIITKYIIGEERSFTIIAFPIPEIGDDFSEIFEEIIKINSLDVNKYAKVQQKIIDALDQAEYIRVIGKGDNKTYMTVCMHELQNPQSQTNFENCLADVNIPLGEVFTSPKLSGTNGLLNVSCVYLNELKYIDLQITFEDGYIKDYTCNNFDNEEDNKNYIKENILYNHDTLPIGEFAIGTNTTAYVIANKYKIVYKLPILIVEKMGPHFAVGDTCYSWEEDVKVYNPDGKEIVAKDNEKSAMRKENISKAYVNCHTDITIPYDELGEITALKSDGTEIPIIRNGRFVLEGCELLNEPFSVAFTSDKMYINK
ncbi:MAG: aminopeptidase [Eubacterium sp.]